MNRRATVAAGRGRRTAIGAGLLVAASFALTACGGSSSAGSTASASSGAVPTATAPYTGAQAQVSAADVCSALRAVQQRLVEVGKDGAKVTLNLTLSTLYSQKGALPTMNGSDLDAMTRASCPDDRAKALKAAGITDFSQM